MGSSNQIGMPQDFRNIPSDLIQAPESLGLTTIDQVNSQTEFESTPSENYAFLDGTDILPKLPSIPLPAIPDLSPKNIPEFIDNVRQWLRDPHRPQCQYGYYELCCQVGAPDPINAPPGRDTVERSKRRRKCARCMRENCSFLIFPQSISPHVALIRVPFSGSRNRPECYFPEDVFCCFCMDGVRTIHIGSEFLFNNLITGADSTATMIDHTPVSNCV